MRRNRGFTLVELLIVVLILGALAAIAVPRISQSAQNAKTKACDANIDILNSQIEMYAADNDGTYPSNYATISGNTDYFPDGAPSCPLTGTYSMNGSTYRVSCDH